MLCFFKTFNETVKMDPTKKGVLIICDMLRKEILKMKLKALKKKRLWVRQWISRRNMVGASNSLCYELRNEDPSSYKNFLRMDNYLFEYLLDKVKSLIQKEDTFFRKAIPARTKLEIVLRFLATGNSFTCLQYLFRVPKNTISTFVPDVCDAIYTALKEFIKVSTTFLTLFSPKSIQLGKT